MGCPCDKILQVAEHWRVAGCSPGRSSSGSSTCRILSHLCICNLFVRSHPLCPKWAAAPWHTGAKSKKGLLHHECPYERWVRRQPSGRGPIGRPSMHWASKFEQFSRIKHWYDWKDVAANAEQWMVEVDDFRKFCTE